MSLQAVLIGGRGWARAGLVLIGMCAVLQGCANLGKTPVESSATAAETFNQALAEGNAAVLAGDLTKAHAQFDRAARADPASKQPWLRKAQIALDASDYGLAIQSSQEVNQRDSTDVTAKSITTVAGLRAASQALRALRQDNAVSGSTRGEAEALARTIREALGEEVLVPRPNAVADAPTNAATAPKPASRAAAARARSAVPAAPARPASAAGSRGSDPFGTLKLGN